MMLITAKSKDATTWSWLGQTVGFLTSGFYDLRWQTPPCKCWLRFSACSLAIVTAGWVPLTSNTLLQRIRQHQHLRDLRNKLLRLHACLLETERIAYEQVRGRVSSGEPFNSLSWTICLAASHLWACGANWWNAQADEPVSLDNVQNLLMPARWSRRQK